ncbi:class I SAM-dependent DNA methyltransferase [Pseudomonas aeruginosa]|uniref:class I SAM-dependent DNA methyltransferase n=1 Tax=Pseudomonas aeruginosa TaxID=287 RepID=UPI0008AB3F4C|nr:N-6 DNA methylase [Pseudomonas aeruginosa]OFK99270.1 SAM-dependent methyltransferase [Pseudomonas aeruginosa]HBP4598776.1 N-6 DNA methylase [Pseudomonas aeruginosa]
MSNATHEIVNKLWNLCNVLKDDGVTYHQYVTELTYLLFLKMAKETGTETRIPKGYRWDDLERTSGSDRLQHYRLILGQLSSNGSKQIRAIFDSANTFIKKPSTLSTLVSELDKLDWYSARREGLGDIYEGLLEKNANEKKSGAGQYFTPRPLIDSLVTLMRPTPDDIIQDPAAGTGGFLIAANHYIREHNDVDSLSDSQKRKYRKRTFYGMEHVQDTHRLALMNMILHDLESDLDSTGIRYGDTLSPEGEALPKASLILTNPPFGTKKGGGLPSRDFLFPTSNKQFCFLQHIYEGLQPGGRAAVVLPDNVLFESGIGRQIRGDLMEKCNLHTILRLPTGIFYAQGVKTNVLFFTRGQKTKDVWIYDMRTNMPQYGKRTHLIRSHFADFESAFGTDPFGNYDSLAHRKDGGKHGRFRKFDRDWISERNDNLDILWIKEISNDYAFSSESPEGLARRAIVELEGALEELQGILIELSEGSEDFDL